MQMKQMGNDKVVDFLLNLRQIKEEQVMSRLKDF
jgi:hypothetical protein